MEIRRKSINVFDSNLSIKNSKLPPNNQQSKKSVVCKSNNNLKEYLNIDLDNLGEI